MKIKTTVQHKEAAYLWEQSLLFIALRKTEKTRVTGGNVSEKCNIFYIMSNVYYKILVFVPFLLVVPM